MSLLPSPPEVLLGKSDLKICSKFIEHPCRSVVTIKQLCNFIEIALQHGCSPVNLLHIFIIPFLKNTSERLLLYLYIFMSLSVDSIYSGNNTRVKKLGKLSLLDFHSK